MDEIEFLSFEHINPSDFLDIVNDNIVRKHLVEHEHFTPITIKTWISEKVKIDATKGCRIRAVYIDKKLMGWCGIQPDDKGFELAIVLHQESWGSGIPIFKTLMLWAKELGHKEVFFHLLDSRPSYKALQKMATAIYKTTIMGHHFTTYRIQVDSSVTP